MSDRRGLTAELNKISRKTGQSCYLWVARILTMKRIQQQHLIKQLEGNKVLLISGPRLAGKEELIQSVLEELGTASLQINAGHRKERKILEESSREEIKATFSGFAIVVIHEAQHLSNLQEIIEEVLSGSIQATIILDCSFEPLLDDLLREVLDMQGLHIRVLPPAFYELASNNGLPEEEKLLEQRLIFGNYPPVVASLDAAPEILKHLLDTVIVSDLGVTDRINKSEQLLRMLQVLAFSIGEPVSYNEVAEKCGLDNETVERYVLLLEKAHILIRLSSFSTGKRYELKKSHLIYFMDNGVRNMLINNFNGPHLRNDLDVLWKNWLIAERIKWNNINGKNATYWFWRTHTRQTIDFLEQNGETFTAYKTTWEKKKKLKFPNMFQEYYPGVHGHGINRSTYWSFLTRK